MRKIKLRGQMKLEKQNHYLKHLVGVFLCVSLVLTGVMLLPTSAKATEIEFDSDGSEGGENIPSKY